MNHLDVGFSCPGCSKSQGSHDPYTWELLSIYMNEYGQQPRHCLGPFLTPGMRGGGKGACEMDTRMSHRM